MIKDILQDIVAHTHSLGFLSLIKITGSDSDTIIESITDDRICILNAKSHTVVPEFEGTFGMPNLEKLNLHLKNPEYQSNAKIEIVHIEKDGVKYPSSMHFENESGDFQNDYRFMNHDVINEKMKSVKFKGAAWDITFTPGLAAITRLKLQAAANSSESVFQVKTDGTNLIFSFGDLSTHAGSFVFQADVKGKLKHTWAWPIMHVQSILNLDGEITMKISDAGAMQIIVDSGLIEYSYILPAMTK
jgi:hypothetical protein